MSKRIFTAGERVRFTAPKLGAIRTDGEYGNRFDPDTIIETGELGTVSNVILPDGWLAITPDTAKDTHYVPVHPSMIEPAGE